MLHDLRLAIRAVTRRSGGSALAVLVLAMGIAATAVVLSLLEASPPPAR